VSWQLSGTYFENCNCNVTCPCAVSGFTVPGDNERCIVLLAFHVGDETVHRDELWGKTVSLDFRFLLPDFVTAALRSAGLAVAEAVEREPYEGAEYPSRRCYLLARPGVS